MERQYLYLKYAKEDKRRGQHKVADQKVKPGRCWATLQVIEKLRQGWRLQLQAVAVPLLNPAIQNLFLHNNHWKDKHVVTI